MPCRASEWSGTVLAKLVSETLVLSCGVGAVLGADSRGSEL